MVQRRSAAIAVAIALSSVAACAGGESTQSGGDASAVATSAAAGPGGDTAVTPLPGRDSTVPTATSPPGTVAPATTDPSEAPAASSRLARRLRRLVDDAASEAPSVPGLAVHVEAPRRDLDVSAAGGFDDREAGTPLRPNAGFRIASNTKTFTAAAVLRLMEQGALALDDPIDRHLARATVDVLRAGGYRTDVIRVRQLLTHTSGIYDYGQDGAYQAAVSAYPTKRWTRLEQVGWAVDYGRPTSEPGAEFAYSDTGYILLGEVIERASGLPLAKAYRTLLDFDRLGLDETYLESLEPRPPGIGRRAHQYVGELDGFSLDPSFDLYGAAGLVSTVDDLSAFYRALFRGDVFARAKTLEIMVDIPATNRAAGAGMGIFRDDLAGHRCWSHSGFWGTYVVTCPDIDVTIAASKQQAMPTPDFASARFVHRLVRLATGA